MKHLVSKSLATLLVLGFAVPALAMGPDSHATTSAATSTSKTGGVRTEEHGKPAAKLKRTLQGTIKEIGSGSFVLTVRDTNYAVTTSASTRIVNRTWHKITLSDIKVGDKVRVYGLITGTSIAAQIVRDISLPPVAMEHHATSTSAH